MTYRLPKKPRTTTADSATINRGRLKTGFTVFRRPLCFSDGLPFHRKPPPPKKTACVACSTHPTPTTKPHFQTASAADVGCVAQATHAFFADRANAARNTTSVFSDGLLHITCRIQGFGRVDVSKRPSENAVSVFQTASAALQGVPPRGDARVLCRPGENTPETRNLFFRRPLALPAAFGGRLKGRVR